MVAGNISSRFNEPVTWTQLIQTGELKLIKNEDSDNIFRSFDSGFEKPPKIKVYELIGKHHDEYLGLNTPISYSILG